VVKICARCLEVWPGGYRCDTCGGPLTHTSDEGAHALPEVVWKNQRVDYGARRGMIVRFLAIFAGAVLGLYLVRASVPLAAPWSYVGAIAGIGAGVLLWWTIYVAAGRAVRIWVLQRGKLHKRKLARALLAQAMKRG
jgi:hypothetical protein